MFIKRQIEGVLLRHASQYPVVAVMGARQSGKTTLVRHAFPDHPYISLEDPDTRFLAMEDPRGFLSRIAKDENIDSTLIYGGKNESTFKGIHAVNWHNTHLLID